MLYQRKSSPYAYNGLKLMFDPTIEVSERQVFRKKVLALISECF